MMALQEIEPLFELMGERDRKKVDECDKIIWLHKFTVYCKCMEGNVGGSFASQERATNQLHIG